MPSDPNGLVKMKSGTAVPGARAYVRRLLRLQVWSVEEQAVFRIRAFLSVRKLQQWFGDMKNGK